MGSALWGGRAPAGPLPPAPAAPRRLPPSRRSASVPCAGACHFLPSHIQCDAGCVTQGAVFLKFRVEMDLALQEIQGKFSHDCSCHRRDTAPSPLGCASQHAEFPCRRLPPKYPASAKIQQSGSLWATSTAPGRDRLVASLRTISGFPPPAAVPGRGGFPGKGQGAGPGRLSWLRALTRDGVRDSAVRPLRSLVSGLVWRPRGNPAEPPCSWGPKSIPSSSYWQVALLPHKSLL